MRAHLATAFVPVALALSACGPAAPPAESAAAAPEGAGAPKRGGGNVQTMLARETTAALKTFPITALDGRFRANVTAASEPKVTQKSEGGKKTTLFTANIGAKAPVQCWIYGDRVDAGAVVNGALDLAKGGEIGAPEVDVGTYEHGAILYVHTPVVLNRGQALALLKLAIAPREEGSVVCLHDEVGYIETFQGFVGKLVGSATVEAQKPQAKLVDIVGIKLKGKPSGFQERRYETRGDKRVELVYGALLLQGEKGWSIFDYAGGVVLGPNGELQSQDNAVNAKGAPWMRLHLEKTPQGELAYEGVVHGKDVRGKLKPKTQLSTELSVAGQLKELAAGKKTEVRYVEFDDEKLEPREVVFRRDANGAVTRQSGDRTATVALDEHGLVKSRQGEDISLERLLLKNAP